MEEAVFPYPLAVAIQFFSNFHVHSCRCFSMAYAGGARKFNSI